MTIEAGLYSIMSVHVGLTALVSTRIYPLMLPQDCELPAVCYRRVSDVPEYLLNLTLAIQTCRIQVSCFASNLKDALEVKTQVKSALVGATGSYGSVSIEDIKTENDSDLYEPDVDVYHVPIDFLVYYS